MDTDQANARKTALDFLKRHKTGVLSTVSAQNEARSRLLYYVCDDEFTIYFSTLSSTRKFKDITAHPQVSFTVGDEAVPQTLQMEGVVSEITEEQKLESNLASIIEVLMSNSVFYWPVIKLNEGEVKLLQMKPAWVRWADYAYAEKGEAEVFKEIPLN